MCSTDKNGRKQDCNYCGCSSSSQIHAYDWDSKTDTYTCRVCGASG